MCIRAIYLGLKLLCRIYHKGKLIFQCEPITFHVIEDGKLIILGAITANSSPDGLYLDCAPAWTYPVQNGNVLTVEQVYSATQNGNILEVG